jgi:hypothetical protein
MNRSVTKGFRHIVRIAHSWLCGWLGCHCGSPLQGNK